MTMLNDTRETVGSAVDSAKNTFGDAVDNAKHTMGSAKKSTERVASVAFSDIANGVRAVTGAIAMIKSFGVDDALGWIGLARRRNSFESVAIFGSGLLVGAGVGMLLAPMSGAELREAFLMRLRGVEKDAEKVAGKVKDAVINAEHKVEDVAIKAKDAVVCAAKDVATGAVIGAAKDVVEGAEKKVIEVKDAIVGNAKDAVDGAEKKADNLANKAKDAVGFAKDGADDGDQKAENFANKTKDSVDAGERKADVMSDKARDALAATERRNNGTTGPRYAPRNQ